MDHKSVSKRPHLMYSPADRSIDEFCKHQEELLPHTSPYRGKTNVDIGCGPEPNEHYTSTKVRHLRFYRPQCHLSPFRAPSFSGQIMPRACINRSIKGQNSIQITVIRIAWNSDAGCPNSPAKKRPDNQVNSDSK